MKKIMVLYLLLLSGCGTLPQLYEMVEYLADDTVRVIIAKEESTEKKTDVVVPTEMKDKVAAPEMTTTN
jgi:hypothetical protein